MTKAKRQTIALGDVPLDVFQLPDGSYCMSLTQVAETVGKGIQNVSDFLDSKRLKALPGIEYTGQKNDTIEVDSSGQTRGGTRISPIPIGLATIYWYFQAKRGNKNAETLVIHGLYDSLLRRADEAFGIVRTMDEYNQELVSLRRSLSTLSDNYAIDDDARAIVSDMQAMLDERDRENAHLREKIRELGGDDL